MSTDGGYSQMEETLSPV